MMKKYLLVYICLIILPACGEIATEWELSNPEVDAIVIEAILTNDKRYHTFKISKPAPSPNETSEPISGAEVQVKLGNITYDFEEAPTLSGNYTNTTPIDYNIGETSFLDVTIGSKNYQAQAQMPPVHVFGHLTFSPIPDTDSLSIENAPQPYSEYEEAMYEISIDWSHLTTTGKTKTKLFYYTFNTIDIGQIFSPPKETIQFPKGSRVLIRKHSLSPPYAEFLRGLVAESQWQGGLFEESKDNLPTNISNGGLGFFSASAVLIDSLIAE